MFLKFLYHTLQVGRGRLMSSAALVCLPFTLIGAVLICQLLDRVFDIWYLFAYELNFVSMADILKFRNNRLLIQILFLIGVAHEFIRGGMRIENKVK